MKLTINDSHTDYIYLTPDEIFHEITINGVGIKNIRLFLSLLQFYKENKKEFSSWINSEWFSNKNIKNEFVENVMELLEEVE